MNQSFITKINGVDIVTVERDGDIYVPVKPICQALGIMHPTQLEKLKNDPTFSDSVVSLRGITATDGKQYETSCLPLWLTYLWLGTINPKNVSDEARPKVLAYRLECARALYEHFTGSMRRTIETNNAEIQALQAVNDAISREKEARSERRKAEEALARIRSERLNPQPVLF